MNKVRNSTETMMTAGQSYYKEKTASQFIDPRIRFKDWRGETLARMRELIPKPIPT